MVESSWTERFRDALVVYYGESRATASTNVIIPAILKDFCEMLRDSDTGISISEEYNTEDKKTVIHVEGVKRVFHGGYKYVMTALRVGEENVGLPWEGVDIGHFAV